MPKKLKINKAPLVVPDRNDLGDKRLSGEEIVAYSTEKTRKQAEGKRIPGQKELEDQDRSSGPRMHPSELVLRLRKANKELFVRDGGVPGCVALYVYVEPRLREEGSEDHPFNYVGGFKWEPLPEFSSITTDEWGVAKREFRSWRSVVIDLIKTKVITYTKAVELFGEPTGSRAHRWFDQLRAHKPF